MSRRFFSGASLEQAVLAAARHYDLDPERVAYAQREKKHGFLNVRRKFVIEVDPERPERPPGEEVPWEPKLAGRPGREPVATEAPSRPATEDTPVRERRESHAPRPSSPSREERATPERERRDLDRPAPRPKPLVEAVTDDPLEAADLALGDIADFLYYEMYWDIALQDDETVKIEIGGEDSHKLVEEDGRVLRSVEHLLPRLIRSKLGRGVSCTVDCEGFKAAHEEHLVALAERVAGEVHDTGQSRLLEPMTPADRRVVHVSLADDPNVDTESEGRGFKKRVRIVAVDDAEGDYDDDDDFED